MLKHTNEAIIVAFGENKIKVNLLIKFLGKIMKNKVLNSEFKKIVQRLKNLFLLINMILKLQEMN